MSSPHAHCIVPIFCSVLTILPFYCSFNGPRGFTRVPGREEKQCRGNYAIAFMQKDYITNHPGKTKCESLIRAQMSAERAHPFRVRPNDFLPADGAPGWRRVRDKSNAKGGGGRKRESRWMMLPFLPFLPLCQSRPLLTVVEPFSPCLDAHEQYRATSS